MALSSMSVVIILISITFSLNMCVGTYEYLSLVLQWQPGYCRTHSTSIKCDQSLIVNDKFTIHGLLPSNKSDPQPTYCNTDSNGKSLDVNKTISSIVKDLEVSWPSLIGKNDMFWEYQWKKHETCYYDGKKHRQYKYFTTAENFWKGFDIFNKLKAEGIVPSGKIYTIQDVIKAIKKQYTGNTVTIIPEFKCSNISPFELYEVTMCLDHDGIDPINCTKTSNCGKQFLWKLK